MVVVGVRAYIKRYAGGLSEMNQRCTCIMTQQRHVWLMSVMTGSKCSFIGDPFQWAGDNRAREAKRGRVGEGGLCLNTVYRHTVQQSISM